MPTKSIGVSASIGGLSFSGSITETAGGQIGEQYSPVVGQAGTLTTRTDNDTGVATLGNGHGITTGNKVDVFWTGGARYGMDATVSVNAVTIDSGSGDNLPSESTSLVVAKCTEGEFTFTGDDALQVVVGSNRACSVTFFDSSTPVMSIDLAAGCVWLWSNSLGTTNPFAGQSITSVYVAAKDTANVPDVRIGVVHANV